MSETTKITIPGTSIEAEVDFDYQPAERQTWDDPGCSASAEINTVMVGGVDITELISDELIEELDVAICKQADENAYESRCEARMDNMRNREDY